MLKGKRERKVGWFLQRGGGSKYKGEIFEDFTGSY